MDTPNPIPLAAHVIICIFVFLMLIAVVKTGEFLKLFVPDNSGKFGNNLVRQVALDFIIFFKIKSSEKDVSVDEISIHEEIRISAFEQEFQRYHKTIVRDVAELWLSNRKYKMGMSFPFVVNYLIEKTFDDLQAVPQEIDYKPNVQNSIKQIVSQYDWSIS
jgi:hypothetical protein